MKCAELGTREFLKFIIGILDGSIMVTGLDLNPGEKCKSCVQTAIAWLISDRIHYYSLDFLFPSLRLVLEANGFVWHGLGNSEKKDAIRTGWLEKLGFKVVILPGEEYNDHEKLRKKILEVLISRSEWNSCFYCKSPLEDVEPGLRACPKCRKGFIMVIGVGVKEVPMP